MSLSNATIVGSRGGRISTGKGSVSVVVRARLLVSVLLICVVVLLAIPFASASATLVHPFVGSFGSFTNPQALAVDQQSGDVYVLDVASESIQRFTALGSPAPFSALSSNTLTGAAGGADAIPEGGFNFDSNSAAQVAIDNSGGPADGYIYVANSFGGGGVIDVFDQTGTFVGELDPSAATPLNGGEPCGVAVAPSGAVYASYFGSHVDKYTPTDANPAHDTFAGQLENLNSISNCNVAVDAAEDVFVSKWATGPLYRYAPSQLNQEAPAGSEVDTKSLALAVNPPDSHVFVDEGERVTEFDTAGVLVGQSGLEHLSGTSYGVAVDGATGDLYASDAGSGTVQHFGPAEEQSFLPEARTDPANDLAPTHATLAGLVTPKGFPTTYWFEYGTSTAYGSSIPAPHDGEADSNLSSEGLQRLNGLTPGTAYHYRLVAADHDGNVHGEDATFTTTVAPPASAVRPGIPGSGFLPDERGWEQVSPIDKNGSDVLADSGRVRAAVDGRAVGFSSLGGFGDVSGTGVATDYMAVRDGSAPTGWATHAITPPQKPLAPRAAIASMDPLYDGDFSPDLSKGVFRAWSPLGSDPGVASVENDYLRTDLRSPGAGAYELVTACPACAGTPLVSTTNSREIPRFVEADADFGRIVFESSYDLTLDAPPQILGCGGNEEACPRLYEWDHGTVRLEGILPDGTAAAASVAGRGAYHQFSEPNAISADGRRVFFTDDSESHGGVSGALYMRLDNLSTVQINASEKTVPDSSQPATFWASSRDGTRAIFTTDEELTNDDTNGDTDAYLWDANSTPHLTRISVGSDPGSSSVAAVIGASADAHWVYYIAQGQLYLWHDGTTTFVGELATAGDDLLNAPEVPFSLAAPSSRVSPDGRTLVFTSHSGIGLTGYNQQCAASSLGCTEIYVYSADAKRLECASCNPTGAPPESNASINTRTGTSGAGTTSHVSHALSDDGRYVFFSTADALVPQDTNGKVDAYEYDTATGTLHLLSSGRFDDNSYFMDASPDGKDVFVLTDQALAGWDRDGSYDLYDARVGGGVPNPAPPTPECPGDACRTSGASVPANAVLASSTLSGPGNLHPAPPGTTSTPRPLRCRHGLVRRKVHGRSRCVRPRVRAKPRKAAAGKRSKLERTTLLKEMAW